MTDKTITEFLKKHGISSGAGFIIAVSGGADSISLLHAFKNLNLRIIALHCNFRLRGEESDKDEEFVKGFCKSHGISLHIKQFDTGNYARQKGLSIEMAARELRYSWFREMKQKTKMDYIVTGHQADDVAETLFINLCRGTGIRGLSGIKPVNDDILRPLLSCSREEILGYIGRHQLSYRNDSSNASLDFMRNIIRHKIIPVCKEINPSFLNTVQENCQALYETEILFKYGIRRLQDDILEQKGDELLIHIGRSLSAPAPYTLLFETLHPFGFNKHQVSDILRSHQASSGKHFYSKDFVLSRERHYWRISARKEQAATKVTIEGEGIIEVEDQRLSFEFLPRTALSSIPDDPHIVCMDAAKINFPLQIRHWRQGDKFCPLGMHLSQKKVSDFFNDRKFTTKQKQECLLLTADEKIAWIIGYRPDERFKITPVTDTILKIVLLP